MDGQEAQSAAANPTKRAVSQEYTLVLNKTLSSERAVGAPTSNAAVFILWASVSRIVLGCKTCHELAHEE